MCELFYESEKRGENNAIAERTVSIYIESNLDEMTEKAEKLIETLKEAIALADRLASSGNELKLDV